MDGKVTDEIEIGELIEQVTATRAANDNDPFKLDAALQTEHAAALAASKSSKTDSLLMGGDQASSSNLVTQPLGKLGDRLRNPFHYYDSLPEEDLLTTDRTTARVSYGWEQDQLGDLGVPLRILTRHVRPVALECLRAGWRREGWQLYPATLPWHIKLGHWKFLFAFPVRTRLVR